MTHQESFKKILLYLKVSFARYRTSIGKNSISYPLVPHPCIRNEIHKCRTEENHVEARKLTENQKVFFIISEGTELIFERHLCNSFRIQL